MSPRAILLTLAALFAVAGLSFGLTTVHSGSTSCGAVFKSGGDAASKDFTDDLATGLENGTDATTATTNMDACHSALGDRKPLTYGALGVAAFALIAGVAASGDKPTNADGSEKPSIWR